MIPFVDLKIQYERIKDEIKSKIEEVLKKTDFILGEYVNKFEEDFARYCDSDYCIGVASGTDALHLALRALDIGKGDEVITVANTFVATVLAISYIGAKPVLVDIDSGTYNIDLNNIEEKITRRTKAIIPVHLYGQAVDMIKLKSLADKHNIDIVEDACQAHGARFNNRKVGSFGIMGCFSFYPGKNLGCYGDGGAIVTDNKKLYDKLRMLRNYGSPEKYHHEIVGYNSRLDTIQAAVLRVKLNYLDEWNKKRLNNACFYSKNLKGIGDLILPEFKNDGSHVFHLYVVRTKSRDKLLQYLKERNIQCGVHYPVPIYSLGAYSHCNYNPEDFTITEEYSKQILSLPMYPELTEEQISEVTDLIRRFYERK